jgi:predicted RNA methylase
MIQTIGKCRDTTDKFYTNPNVARDFCKIIKQKLLICKNDIIIEPSAGNGVFIKYIESMGCNNLFFYDIEPEHKRVKKQDFLTLKKKIGENQKCHIIGNPPFGKQSCLAIQFLKKATQFADTISFILPKSFKKDSMRNHINLNFHLIYEKNVKPNSFLVNNTPHNVECVFQIWQKEPYERKQQEKLTTQIIDFVKKDDDHDIVMTRVGDKAGFITTNTTYDKSSSTNYFFIKFNKRNLIDEQINIMTKFRYTFDNTVTLRSISKQEIIKKVKNSKTYSDLYL